MFAAAWMVSNGDCLAGLLDINGQGGEIGPKSLWEGLKTWLINKEGWEAIRIKARKIRHRQGARHKMEVWWVGDRVWWINIHNKQLARCRKVVKERIGLD